MLGILIKLGLMGAGREARTKGHNEMEEVIKTSSLYDIQGNLIYPLIISIYTRPIPSAFPIRSLRE